MALFCDGLDLGSGEEFEINQYLVVAGASAVDFFTDVSQFACQHQLYLGVYVLDPFFYDKFAFSGNVINLAEFV